VGIGKKEHCNSALWASDSNNLFCQHPLGLRSAFIFISILESDTL
jgi:hypothetical protein